MTIRLKIDGSQVWWRTDSYWNSAATSFSSTWGPGIAMSTHWISGADNNGSTNIGKTFVFAYGDGSGIQLNHLTFAATAPTGSATASGGTNNMTTAAASFSNSPGGCLTDNYCITSTLLLAGTTDTSGLAQAIKDYSDGYKATWDIALE